MYLVVHIKSATIFVLKIFALFINFYEIITFLQIIELCFILHCSIDLQLISQINQVDKQNAQNSISGKLQ